MRILLVAPLDPVTPNNLKLLVGGENTYTKTLLKYPAKGINFIHFETALKQSMISIHPVTYLVLFLQRLHFLPLSPRTYIFRLKSHFDLVYAHAHPIALFGRQVPIIISDSSSNIIFLKYYLKISPFIMSLQNYIKKIIFKTLRIYDGEIKNIYKTFVFSKWAKNIKSKLGIRAKVLYPGLPIPKNFIRRENKKIKILFVGVWFERKGGPVLLEAYKKLKQKYSEISLTLYGQMPKYIKLGSKLDITQKDFVSYQQLLNTYKTHDILVHVPPKIEGYGMAVTEAMSYGMCPIVTDVCALPEFVKHQKTGLIIKPNSSESLESALTFLIRHKKLITIYGKAAREKFRRQFSTSVFNRKLYTLFKSAIS